LRWVAPPSGRVAQTRWGRASASRRNRRSLLQRAASSRRRAAITWTYRTSTTEEVLSHTPMARGPRGRSTEATRQQRVAGERPAAVRPGPVPPTKALTMTARRNGPEFSVPIAPPGPRLASRATPTAAAERVCHHSRDRWVSMIACLRRKGREEGSSADQAPWPPGSEPGSPRRPGRPSPARDRGGRGRERGAARGGPPPAVARRAVAG